MNYVVIAASIKKTTISRKTKFLTAALLIATSSAFAQTTITDFDGNVYNTVVIGSQVWMKENLKTTHYKNGNIIPNILSDAQWQIMGNGACADYNNDLTKTAIYGKLYKGFSVIDPSGLCPVNWHIPKDWEWNILVKNLDSLADTNCVSCQQSFIVGGAMKEIGLTHWACGNGGANNGSGFTGLPAGIRQGGGVFDQIGNYGYFWSSSLDSVLYYNINNAGGYYRVLNCLNSVLGRGIATVNAGMSVRCVRDLPHGCGTGAITADGPTTFCAGNFVNLKSDVVGGTYQWKKNGVNVTTNGTSRTYKATATGSYTCVATCNGTALTSNAISVTTKTNAFASVTASGATSFCAGDSVTLNCTNLGSNYSVQWYRTNISMENATNYSQVVKQPGTYKVVTRNLTNGCSRISGSAITTNVNCRIAGDVTSGAVIQENTNVDSRFIDNELSQGVHIFPNPNSGIFSFNYDGEETGDAVLQVINNMGQSIYQSRLTIPEGGFTQDLQLGDNITKGIYIVRLLINDSYHDSKVMVK